MVIIETQSKTAKITDSSGTRQGGGGGGSSSPPPTQSSYPEIQRLTGGSSTKGTSSYPQIQAAVGSAPPGTTYTTPDGTQVETQQATSYPAVAAERERLVKEAAAQGTATEQQYKEAYTINLAQDAGFQAYSKAVDEYAEDLKRQGIQNAAEYFAAVKGERSPRQSSYPEILAERERLRKEQSERQALASAPNYPTPWISDTRFYDGKGNVYYLEESDKKIIAAAEKLEQREVERAARYADFEQRLKGQNWFVASAQKLGYAVGIGYGEQLASGIAKGIVYIRAANSPILRSYARAGAEQALKDTGEVLAYEYDPRTARGWGNILLTGVAVFGVAKQRQVARARAASKVTGEPQPSEAVKSKFNKALEKSGEVKGEVIPQQTTKSYYTKTGEKVTQWVDDAGRVADEITDESGVLTERGIIKTDKPGSEVSIGRTTNPKAKVQISQVGKGDTSITQITKKGILYNYETITTQQGFASTYKVNRITGRRTYLGSYKFKPTTDLKPQDTTLEEARVFTGDQKLATKEVVKQVLESQSRPGVKMEIETTKVTTTTAKEVPSAEPAITKRPAQAAGTIIKENIAGDLDVTPIQTTIKVVKTSDIKQPAQTIKIEPQQVEIKNTILGTEITKGTPTTTTTPAIVETTTGVAQKSVWRLSPGNKEITSYVGNQWGSVTRFVAPPEKPILTIKYLPYGKNLASSPAYSEANRLVREINQDAKLVAQIDKANPPRNKGKPSAGEVIAKILDPRTEVIKPEYVIYSSGQSTPPTANTLVKEAQLNEAIANLQAKVAATPKPKTPAATTQPTPASPVVLSPQTQQATQVRIVQAPEIVATPARPTTIPKVTLPPDTQLKTGLTYVPKLSQNKAREISATATPVGDVVATPRDDIITDYKRQIAPPPSQKTYNSPVPNIIRENDILNQDKTANRAISSTRQRPKQRQQQEPQIINEPAQEQITTRQPFNPRIPRPKEPEMPNLIVPTIPDFKIGGLKNQPANTGFGKHPKTQGRIERVKSQSTKKGFILGKRQRIAEIETDITPGLLSSSTSKKKKSRGAKNGIF